MPKYWVGGTGNWTDTTHWANTSGGAGSTGVPASFDDVNFDSSSGSGTVTINSTITVNSLVTNTHTIALNFSAGNPINITGYWQNNGTSTRTITFGANVITFGAGNNQMLWSDTTNLTLNAGTSEIIFTGGALGGARTLMLGTNGLTFNKITLTGVTSGYHDTSFQYTGTTTINTLAVTGHNYIFVPTAPTLNVGTLTMTGTSGALCSISAIGVGGTIALTNASTAVWTTFRNVTFTGASVTATNSLDLGRVTGATITPPSGGGGGSTYGMVG